MDLNKYFSGGFPLTTERLQFMNDSVRRGVELITKMAGSGNLIFEGMELSGGNLTSGTIVIEGEILPFEASSFNNRIAIFETEVDVPYNEDVDNDGNLDLKPADTIRVARAASSGGVFSVQYSTFNRVGQLAGAQLPIGSIVPYEGNVNDIPNGWELYTGLQDRFIMGAGGTSSLNTTGGVNEVTLTENQMPIHNHEGRTNQGGLHDHSTPSENDDVGTGTHYRIEGFNRKRGRGAPAGNHFHNLIVENAGGGQAHENKPAFRALNFIKRVSI